MTRHRHLRIVTEDDLPDGEATLTVLRQFRDRVPAELMTDPGGTICVQYDWTSEEANHLFEAMQKVRGRDIMPMTLNEMQRAMSMTGVVNAFLDWEVEHGG